MTPVHEPIPVILITDSNYIWGARITIRSMLKYKKPDTRYNIHVLGVDLSDRDVADLRKESSEIDIIRHTDKYKDICRQYMHVTNAAMYKFDMASLFPQYDKVIYTDVDVLILDDLTALYDIDVSDAYCGMVRDFRAMALLRLHEKMHMEQHFFSGLLLANLALWRRDNLYPEFMRLVRGNDRTGYQDQDIFNIVCQKSIRPLSVRYLMATCPYWGPPGTVESFYEDDELRVVNTFRSGRIVPGDIVSLHYFMPSKPWKSLRNSRYMRYWWRFLTPCERVSLYFKILVKKIQSLLGWRHK